MKTNKTKEDIKKEYIDFPIQTDVVDSLDEFLTFIEIGIDDTKEYERDYEKELKENKWWKLDAMIRNFFFFIFEQEEVELYDEDSEVLKSCIEVTRKYREFYERIQSIATEENFKELVRLVDFSCEYYEKQMDYYDYLRDSLDLNARGIRMYNSRYEDYKEPFFAFMEEEIKKWEEQRKGQKAVQYVKKG